MRDRQRRSVACQSWTTRLERVDAKQELERKVILTAPGLPRQPDQRLLPSSGDTSKFPRGTQPAAQVPVLDTHQPTPFPSPMKTRLALLALLLPLPLLADPAEPTTGAFWRDVVVNGDKKIKSFRIPGIAVTPKNTLIAVYDHRYNNSGDLPGNVDVGMARSTDGGKTWSKTKPIIDFDASVKGSNGNGVGDPCVLVDKKTGTIWVAALWSFGNRAWGGSGPGMTKEETGQFVLVKSENDGVSWSRPINITSQVKNPEWRLCFQGPGNGICTSKGILVFPAQYRDKSGTEHSFFIYSKDGGKTWKPSPPAAPGKRTTEAQVCEIPGGSLLISMRNHNSGNRAWAVFRAPGGDLDKGKWEEVYFDIPDPVCAAGLASNPRNLKQVVFHQPRRPRPQQPHRLPQRGRRQDLPPQPPPATRRGHVLRHDLPARRLHRHHLRSRQSRRPQGRHALRPSDHRLDQGR